MYTTAIRPTIGALLLGASLITLEVSAQSTAMQLQPGAGHAMALGRIGGSGLRSLLSASGNLGDLRNRAGSYRLAAQLEHARVSSLEARLAALEDILANPSLPGPERQRLTTEVQRTRDELRAVPQYEAAYRAATAQVEALLPAGFIAGGPLFLLTRAYGHVRDDRDDGLRVFSEALLIGPVWVPSERLILGASLGVGRTDVDISPFDGHSGSWSIGPRLSVGSVLADGWGFALELGHSWAHGSSRIMQPGPAEATEVLSSAWSETTAFKAEILGRLQLEAPGSVLLTVRPRTGVFLSSAYSPATTNSLGERSTGPFGTRSSLAALRTGASLGTELGGWASHLYLGWERELTDEMSELIHDRDGWLAVVGVSRSLGRGRRFVVDYTRIRGLEELRRVSELTFVLILDG